MITVGKSPLRISLLGGGSDIDWYVNKRGIGYSFGFTINKYTYIALNSKNNNEPGILNYRSREEYDNIDSICHPIIREVLNELNIKKPIELSSFGDKANGSGLGSSSSFCVCLIKSICHHFNLSFTAMEIAHIASEIEINRLSQPIGRQDQYLSALGDIRLLKFKPNGSVQIGEFNLNKELLKNYFESLYLVNTGILRSASNNLKNLKDDSNSIYYIDKVKEIAENFFLEISKSYDQSKNIDLLEESIIQSWKIKKKMNSVINSEIEDLEEKLNKNGGKVLKLLGAGGGGFFLLKPTINREDLESNLDKIKLDYSRITLNLSGCKTISY